jgi:5'-methylthioadenosine phosphorylase
MAHLGIIGGSGVYDLDGLRDVHWQTISSPFGEPSDQIMFGKLLDEEIAFLPRHGRGHKISPTDINYRANIDALKRAGVTEVISVSAVGSLKEHLEPGTFVIVDQFIDRTFARDKSFFGSGCVAHVSLANPVCSRLGDQLEKSGMELGLKVMRGGTYLVMEGPQFSTRAESELYRSWGCDVIGMTNMPEAKLAREAELCYATVAMVTDYDCWHPYHDNVNIEQILAVLSLNAKNARALVTNSAKEIIRDQAISVSCSCRRALDFAVVTSGDARDPSLVERLDAVAGRVLK